jgi:outer membrane protein OmpA-like peptidoglycan-associated protein
MASSFRDSLGLEPEESPQTEPTPPEPPAPSVPAPPEAGDRPLLSGEGRRAQSPQDLGDVEEAQWSEEEAPPTIGSGAQSPIILEDASQRRRRKAIWTGVLAVALVLALVLSSHGGTHKAPAPSGPAPAPTPAEGVGPKTTPTSTSTTPTSAQSLLPTGAETAAAQHALSLAREDIYADQDADSLVATGAALQSELKSRYGYSIQVITSGSPRPFTGNQAGVLAPQRGQLSAAFATQAGVVILEATAGQMDYPYVLNLKLLPQTKLIIPADSMFASGSSALLPAGQQFVSDAAHQLALASSVRCVGYTDSQGGAAYNMRLGLARAKTVCSELSAQGSQAQLSASSEGEAHPRASNATAAGRALNRRVELDATYPG